MLKESRVVAVVNEVPVQGGTSKHFVEFRREDGTPAPILWPKRFTRAMHIDLQTLAAQAHGHRT